MLATFIPTKQNKLDFTERLLNEDVSINKPNPLSEDNLDKDLYSSNFASNAWNKAKSDIGLSQNARTLIELGDANMLRGLFSRALDNYKKAIDLNPLALHAYPRIVDSALRQSNPVTTLNIDLANKYFLKLVEITKRRPEILHSYVLFKLFFYRDKPNLADEALKETEEIIKNAPDNFEAVNTYGFILLDFKQDLKNAEKYFKRSFLMNQKYKHAVDNLGVCFFRQGDLVNAKKYYDMALDLDPFFNSAYQNLASLYITKGEIPKAIHLIKEAINQKVEIEPQWKDKVGQLYFSLQKYPEAIDWYTERLKENSKNYAVLNDLGTCYSRMGDLDKALECYYSAIKVFNDIPSQRTSLHAFYNLGKIGMMKGDPHVLQQASRYIQALDGKNWFSCYLAGAAAFRRNDFEKSKEFYREAYAFNQNRPEIYPDLSFILMDIDKKYGEAIDLLIEGLSKFKNDLLIQNNLAYAYIKSNQLNKAKKVLTPHFKKPQLSIAATVGLYWIRKGNLKKGNFYYDQTIDSIGDTDPVKLTLASQIKEFENALYWFNEKNGENAKKHIKLAKSFGSTFMTADIKALEMKIMKI